MMLRTHISGLLIVTLVAMSGCGGSGNGSSDRTPSHAVDFAARPTASDMEGSPTSAAKVASDRPAMDTFLAEGSSAEGAWDGAERKPLEADADTFTPSTGNRQSGTLTAGSFDDVSNFGDYRRFLQRHNSRVAGCQLPLTARSQQTLITITDEQGNPIGDARCRVTRPGEGQNGHEHVLLNMKTGTDGRVMLVTDAVDQQLQQTQGVRLQVILAGSQEPTIDEIYKPESRWNIVVEQVDATLPTQLDLALVIDTTGSMGDELEYLKTEIDSIVSSVNRMFPNVAQRYSLVTYRDNGDEYVCRSYDFTDSLTEFRRKLDQQSAAGGGDFPEAMDTALQNAGQLSWRNGNTARVMFLIGDAPPHKQNTGRALAAVEDLRQKGVRVFPVGASGVETTAEIVMRTTAFLTMGQYLFLTDHSGVGNAHATPDVPEFAVERLDRLMVRMIASELAGKRLVAQEVIAIENGELHTSHHLIPRCVPEPQISVIAPLPALCCLPPPSGTVVASVSSGPSQLTLMLGWIGDHGLFTLLAVISGTVVFDRLAACQARRWSLGTRVAAPDISSELSD